MAERISELVSAKEIAEHTVRTLLSVAKYPEFAPGSVPVAVAAKVLKGCLLGTGWNHFWMASDRMCNSGKRKDNQFGTAGSWEASKLLHQSQIVMGADRIYLERT